MLHEALQAAAGPSAPATRHLRAARIFAAASACSARSRCNAAPAARDRVAAASPVGRKVRYNITAPTGGAGGRKGLGAYG